MSRGGRFLGVLLLCVAASASAMPLPVADIGRMVGPDAAINLWPVAGIRIVPAKGMPIGTVAAPGNADRFLPTAGDAGNLGYVRGAVWLRFALRNAAAEPRRVLLRVGRPRLDSIRLYLPAAGGGWQVEQGGDRTPFAQHAYPYHEPIFPITLAAHSAATYYVRVVSQSSISLPLRLFSPEYLATRLSANDILVTMIYGVIAVMALYNLVLFFGLRERSYLWYSLFAVAVAGYNLSLQGYGAQYLWSASVWWSDRSLLVFGALGILFALQFFRSFVPVVRELPLWKYTIDLLRWTAAVMVPLVIFAPYRLAGETLTAFGGLAAVVPMLIAGAIVVTRPHYRPARHLLFAWGVFLLASVYRTLELFGVLPLLLGEDTVLVGGCAMVTLLSFGLAAKVDEIRRAKEVAQAHLIELQRDTTLRLEHEVEERTRAYRAARDEAQRANRMKDELVAVISHEIRNPLTATLGTVRLLREGGLSDAQVPLVEGLEQSGAHVQALLDDLLDLSRIDAGRLKLERSVFSLTQLLEAAVGSVQGLATAKGLALRLNSDALPAYVYGDQRRTRQVLLNLLGNALKFTDTGGISVDAYPLESDGLRHAIYMAVTDSGSGIAESQLEHLFQPFAQVDQSGEQHMGSGLGLAISKSLVAAMGGEIGVESTVGQGSIFWFVLPFEEAEAHSPTLFTERQPKVMPPALSILLVEDEAMNRCVIAKLLEAEGHEVSTAADGEAAVAAVAAVERRLFDLVLMDLQMPKLDGIEATRRLRLLRDFRRATMPVFALTANVRDSTQERCRAVGIDAVISKPLDMQELNRLLCTRFGAAYTSVGNVASVHVHGDALLDVAVLQQRWNLLGAAAFDEIVQEYARSSARTMDGISAAWNLSDRNAIAALAHKLAGTTGTIGLPLMMDFARRLESVAAGSHQEPLDPLMSQLYDCHEASLEALTVWRDRCADAALRSGG